MTKHNLKILSYFLLAVLLTLGLSLAGQSLLAAWLAPTAAPPGNNTDEPVNKGSSLQIKGGPLYVNYDNIAATGFVVYGGNVGIGNTVPQARLDLGTGTGPKFLFYNDNNTSPYAGTKMGFYIDQFSLSNNATFVFATAAAAPGTFIIASKDTGGTTLTERVRVQGETGNVGIGTANPGDKLVVYNGAFTKYTSTGIDGTNDSLLKYGYYNDLQPGGNGNTNRYHGIDATITAGAGSSNKMLFKLFQGGANNNAPATVMTLQGDGNVGIGTPGPDEKLDVSGGNIKTSGAFLSQGGTQITQLPWFNCASCAAGYIKLITPIVDNESNMFIITIKGYQYAGAYSGAGNNQVTIQCGGYAYTGLPTGSALINTGCDTHGTNMPVEIGEENRGGQWVAVIRLGTPTSTWYYNHFTAEYRGWQAKAASGFSWVTGEITPAQTGNTHNVIVNDANGTITTTGNVGIGTTDPNSRLHLYRASGNNAELDIQSIAGAGNHWAIYNVRTDDVAGAYDSTGDLRFWQGNNLVTFSDSGNVGIGTAGPEGKIDLQAGSSGTAIAISANYPDSYRWRIIPTDRGNAIDLDFTASNNADAQETILQLSPTYSGRPELKFENDWFVINNGNVGIGTANPLSKLEIWQDSRYNDEWTPAPGFSIISANTDTRLIMGADAANDIAYIQSMQHATSWVTRNLAINAMGGNVGIGMNPGSYKLDVAGDIRASGAFIYSDRTLKKNIQPISGALDKVLQLNGVEFQWKKDNRPDLGLIAQDVEKVFPDLVNTDQTTKLKSLEYGNLVAPLIEAVKEQQKQIEALKAEIENLKNSGQ